MTSSAHTQQPIDHLLGRQVGNLRIVERIGQGGFGVVYRAENVVLGTPAAIKVLRIYVQGQGDAMKRFQREAKLVSKLDHPNVVRVLDFGEFDGSYYLAMDLLTGQSLKEAILKKRRFSLAQIRILFEKICSTLQYLHQQGIVHRDLKPANLFLHKTKKHGRESIKILDFGVAGIANSQTITMSGTPLGSPIYMPPEQARGESKHADKRSDIYSLTVVLYELLTGLKPFRGGGFAAVLLKQLHDPPPPLYDTSPAYRWSEKLETLIQQGMAKRPEERPDSAELFIETLLEALAEQDTLTPDAMFPPLSTTHPPHEHPCPAHSDEWLNSQDIIAQQTQRATQPITSPAKTLLNMPIASDSDCARTQLDTPVYAIQQAVAALTAPSTDTLEHLSQDTPVSYTYSSVEVSSELSDREMRCIKSTNTWMLWSLGGAFVVALLSFLFWQRTNPEPIQHTTKKAQSPNKPRATRKTPKAKTKPSLQGIVIPAEDPIVPPKK